ncbi:hypothetical protein GCM10009839_93700 [Catenulispora yoronensis]|uniref:Uncharacterized protein n=1 Tax=Catenulispora yoronensis TaxID=450799 RepID=A0ABN2VNA7_9ACTN
MPARPDGAVAGDSVVVSLTKRSFLVADPRGLQPRRVRGQVLVVLSSVEFGTEVALQGVRA